MGYEILDLCTSCGGCLAECPVDAIEVGTPYSINADKCNGCGTCVLACPEGAIDEL